MAPGCGAEVTAETLTEGRCVCGLRYRRPIGAANWDEIVGVVDVTVRGYNVTADRVVRSNGVIYRSEYVFLDAVVDRRANGVVKQRDVESILPGLGAIA